MKTAALIALTLLAACANARAPENINSVPSVQRSITEVRRTVDHIYVAGGVFEGAAAGQLTAFAVTPDDAVVCTFQTAPDPTRSGLTASVTGYRLTVAGLYRALSGIVLPNTPSTATDVATRTFTIETRTAAGQTLAAISASDPRHVALMTFFTANPTPCWNFG